MKFLRIYYKNILCHKVITDPNILTVRVDESLYFANVRFLEDAIFELAAKQPKLSHVILMCSTANAIVISDATIKS